MLLKINDEFAENKVCYFNFLSFKLFEHYSLSPYLISPQTNMAYFRIQ